jgi:reactive intermediate/imine deaminase
MIEVPLVSKKQAIHSESAPQAIGTYSQAIKVGDTVWLSGQIPLDPESMEMVGDDITSQAHQVFNNLTAVARAAGGDLEQMVKLNISMTDLGHFGQVNEIMAEYFNEPYPARACVGVASLPRNAMIEIEAIMVLATP